MALDSKIVGASTGNGAEVNANNELKVALSNTPANIGGVRLFSEVDSGTYTGAPTLLSPRVSNDLRLKVGMDTELFSDSFNGASQNTNLWNYQNSTMTTTLSSGGDLIFNSGTSTGQGAVYRSYQYFPVTIEGTLAVEFTAGNFASYMVANEVVAFGIGNPATATALPTDSCYFQLTSAGLIGVVAFNGVVTQTGTLLPAGSLALNEKDEFYILINNNEVEFWISLSSSVSLTEKLLGKLPTPIANGHSFMQASLPVFMQKIATGAVTSTNSFRFSDVFVGAMGLNTSIPYTVQRCLAGCNGSVGQNGQTQGGTTIYANNVVPTAVALTNTTAAFVGLGGQAAVLPTLAAATDGIIFSFQNPAPSVNTTGRNLLISGVKLQGMVNSAFTGGPVLYEYCIAYGHTGISLTTTESATTHAPRRIPLGLEVYAATAAVGVLGSAGVQLTLQNPIVIRPGEYIQIVAKNVGTVTTTGSILMTATIDAVWV